MRGPNTSLAVNWPVEDAFTLGQYLPDQIAVDRSFFCGDTAEYFVPLLLLHLPSPYLQYRPGLIVPACLLVREYLMPL